MVAIPITTDQPGTAARIAYAGAGEMLALSEFTTRRLRAVIERVLRENHYRAAAQKIRAAIEKTGGVERAADIIEQVARTNEPVTRSSSSAN